MILVKFKFIDTYIHYTKSILELLKTDPQTEIIIDAETGEVIFEN